MCILFTILMTKWLFGRNKESRLVGEFPHLDLEASVLDVDSTGRFAFLAGSKEISVIDLQSPFEKAYVHETVAEEPSIIQCHPTDGSRFALVRRNRCEIYSWSANENRLSMTAHLQGYIRPINSVDWCPLQPNIFASASSEQFRSITVWDLRDPCRLVKNCEMYSATSLIRWDPFREYNFATGGDISVQFWDLRNNAPERHLSMQSSRVLSMAWSPARSGEFAISTKDGSLRIWHRSDFDNAQLVSNYKKIPMFHLRYTPKGAGIISVPQRTRWTSSGLILWRSDTLSPMRLVPSLSEVDGDVGSGGEGDVEGGGVVNSISEESCVLGFGWCRSEFPPSNQESENDQLDNLRESIKPANLISWSRDCHLRVHNLPASFLYVDGVKTPIRRTPQRPILFADSNSQGVLQSPVKSTVESINWAAPNQAASQPGKSESPAFQFVTQEVSLLSSSIGQYTVEVVERDGTKCTVRLRLYYCRRNHYHHRNVCGFDLLNENPLAAADSRTRSDSLPLADLDALFHSTTGPIAMASANTSIPTGAKTLESLPSAGNVTLLVKFPLAYPSPNCPPVFEFIASDPVIHDVTLTKILKDIQYTAEVTVSALRGCLEPCIRKVFKHLNSRDLPFSSPGGDEFKDDENNETILASSDPYVPFLQDSLDIRASSALAEDKSAKMGSNPPSQDGFIPFPRTSGVHISPSGLMVSFGLHQSLVKIVAISAAGSVNQSDQAGVEITRTPRSYHDYRQLVEGKEHLFCKVTDTSSAGGRQQQIRFSQASVGDGDFQRTLKKSRSAEDICGDIDASRAPTIINPSDFSSCPKSAVRSRHFSGKNPDTSSRKTSLTASGRKIAAAVAAEQRQHFRRPSYFTRFTTFHASTNSRKGSGDRTFSGGSPLAVIRDLSALIPMSKYLAKNYSLDITDPKRMCSHNLLVALSTGRMDLIQFWSFVATLSGAKLRQAAFPGLIPPYAKQLIGHSFFRTWLSHFLHLGDAQSLTMLGFVMAAIDAQSTPPALLLTSQFLPATITALLRQQQVQRVNGFWSPIEAQRSPVRRSSLLQSAPAAAARRIQSTVAPPNLSLLEIPDDHSQSSSSSRKSTLKRTTTVTTRSHASQPLSSNKGDRNSTDPSDSGRSELVLNVPSLSRIRSNSYTVRTSVSSENGSSTPGTSEHSHRSPPSTTLSSGGPLEHKDSTLTLVPTSPTPPLQSHQNSEEGATRALLLQYFREQTLMDINGATWEESKPDSPYSSHVWLLSFKHLLQYTHFLKIYVDILTAWGEIIPRAKLSSQWYKVLTWMNSRSSPEYHHTSLREPIDRQCQVILSPTEWRSQHMPIALTYLLSFPTVHSEVICPPSVLGLLSGNATSETRLPLLRCAVCNVTARGVIVACPQCLHGGHMEHMSAWRFRCRDVSEVVCPVPDCECRCAYLRIRSSESAETANETFSSTKSTTPVTH
ncbi:hypothetical protein Aperf_G00000102778 [Anoplocephala perfoliata]